MPFDLVRLLFFLQKFAQYHICFGANREIVLIRTDGDKSNLNFGSQGSVNQTVDVFLPYSN